MSKFDDMTTAEKIARIDWEFEVFGRPAAEHSRWLLEYVKGGEKTLLDIQCAKEAMEDTRNAVRNGYNHEHRLGS